MKGRKEELSNDNLPTHLVSTEPLFTPAPKRGSSISGTTFYFVLQPGLNETYIYERQKACCENIRHNINVIAIQTLQFQKRTRYLNGSTLMKSNSNNKYYKLFFVSSYREENDGCMFGYFFNGNKPLDSCMINIFLNNRKIILG